jgi:VWFA-related protein
MSTRGKVPLLLLLAAIAPAQQDPTFAVGTQLVSIDTIVRKGSSPVTGLTKEDFTVLDNGAPQPIAVFSVRSAKTATAPAIALPPGTVSNRLTSRGETPASATVFLIDRLNTPILAQTKADDNVLRFLRSRGNKDTVGIYTLGRSLSVVQDLTNDAARVDRTIRELKPEDLRRFENGIERPRDGSGGNFDDFVLKERAASTRDALEMVARHLAGVPGRKSLIWVSSGFPLISNGDHVENLNFTSDVATTARALSDANVAVYPVDPRGLAGTGAALPIPLAQVGPAPATRFRQPGFLSATDTMNMLADLTGGIAFYNTNQIEDAIGKAVEDGDLIYTLGFYPAQANLDGKYHRLQVKTSARGATARYRQSYLASALTGAQQRPPTLSELLNAQLDATNIGLLARAGTDQAKPGAYKVTVTVDVHDLQLAHENGRWTGGVDVSLSIPDSGKARTFGARVDVADDQIAALREKGLEVVGAIEIREKNTDLRVVAQDRTTGTAGSLRIMLAGKH